MASLCKNCSGILNYDPVKKSLVCKSCGSSFTAEDVSDQSEEILSDIHTFRKSDTPASYYDANIYVCNHCGAEVIVHSAESSTFCVYCGNPAIVFSRISRQIRPDGLIPFKITKELAIENVKEQFATAAYVPNELRDLQPDKVRGIYVPYWIVSGTFHDAVITESSTRIRSGKGGSKLLSSDTYYSSDELAKARREARDKLRDLELNLRESDIKIEKARKALDKGVVTANMNGIVKTAGDPKSPPTDGSAFITVAGSEGLFVKSGIKESKLGTLKEGDIVTVTSWQTGGRYEAEIKSISPYPDNSGMFSGDGNETYFPFTANLLDREAVLQNGEWVEVSYKTTGDSGKSSGTLTVQKAFVREEGSKKYVYVRDENNKLRKQYIVTGTLSDTGYEVIDGLSENDWIAFPYGKNVKEGAKTREASIGELYG